MSHPLVPAPRAGRVVGVDVARAVALVGMMATHVLPGRVGFEVPFAQQVAGGRASALFALLAGVSLSLVTGRHRPPTGRARTAARVRLVVRALVVLVLGLALGAVPTVIAVILASYAVMFLFAVPFVGLRARSLALLAVGWVLLAPVVSLLLRSHLPPRDTGSPTPSDLLQPVELVRELVLTGYYPAFVWMAYLFTGMALGRIDLRAPRVAPGLLAGGLVLAVGSVALSRLLLARPGVREELVATDPSLGTDPRELDVALTHGLGGTTPTGSWWWLATAAPHSGAVLDLTQTIGSGLAVLGLALLLTRRRPDLWAVVFGAGAMTLTLYSLHVLMMAQGWWPDVETPDHYDDQVLVVAVVGAFFALVPLRGPLEYAVGRLVAWVAGPLDPRARRVEAGRPSG
jgi:Heparan-alpha-glucosaminide N-acetyltransferase, catalytic